jgi:hypothetical protein
MYKCSLCDEIFEALPTGIAVGTQRYGNILMISQEDGRLHNFKLIREKKPKESKDANSN